MQIIIKKKNMCVCVCIICLLNPHLLSVLFIFITKQKKTPIKKKNKRGRINV